MPTRRLLPTIAAAVLAACAGVSPRPEAVNADSLPTRELTAGQQQRLAELVDECVRDVVLRRYEPADRGAKAALALDPRCARARAVRGIVMLQRASEREPSDMFLANAGEAETVLAEQLAPEDPFVAWVRALFLGVWGPLRAAAAAAEAALARTAGALPEERAPLLGLAGTYRYELGEERAALPLLQAYVGLRPDDATANFRIGSCLMRMSLLPTGPVETQDRNAQNHAEAAARAFSRCVELAPGDEDAALAIGAAKLRAGELAGERGAEADGERLLAAAVEQFAMVAERFPDSAEALFRIGVVEEARGRGQAARQAYEAALQRRAGHLGSLLNLAALLASGREDRTAVEGLLERALRVDDERGGLGRKERQQIEQRLKTGVWILPQ